MPTRKSTARRRKKYQASFSANVLGVWPPGDPARLALKGLRDQMRRNNALDTFAKRFEFLKAWLCGQEQAYRNAEAEQAKRHHQGGQFVRDWRDRRRHVLYLASSLHPEHQEYLLNALADVIDSETHADGDKSRQPREIAVIRRDFRTERKPEVWEAAKKAAVRAAGAFEERGLQPIDVTRVIPGEGRSTAEDQLFVVAYERGRIVLRFTNFPLPPDSWEACPEHPDAVSGGADVGVSIG